MAKKRAKPKKQRRGRGEGSITQRTDGRWSGRIDLGFDANGKRIRKEVYGRTRKEAHEKLQDLIAEHRSGMLATPSKIKVGDYLDEWLETIIKPQMAASTLRDYSGCVRVHVKPAIGKVELQKLNAIQVDALYRKIEATGVKSTAARCHKILSKALKRAVKLRIIPVNVCSQTEIPSYKIPEVETWTAKQAETFLKAIRENRLYGLYLLAITTGMRVGEICALRWENVNLEGGELFVRLTTTEDGGTKPPKTEKSRRRVPLSRSVVDAMRDRRRESLSEGNAASPWVFCADRGGMYWRNHLVNRIFKRLIRKNELPEIRFHDLRHCCASVLLQENTHPAIVQGLLGHSKIKTTMDTYSHLIPSVAQQAADTMDRVFGSQKLG